MAIALQTNPHLADVHVLLQLGAEKEENLEGAAEGGAPAAAENTATVHQRVHGGEGFKGGAGGWTEPGAGAGAWKYDVCSIAPSDHARCSGTHQL